MKHPKRLALGLLLTGLLLAVGTPIYVGYAEPSLAGYLLHPTILMAQALPYALGGALWLPWQSRDATATAVLLSGLLLLAGLMIYGPMLRAPGARGGDMIGLAFLAISLGMTAALLVGSAVAWLVLWRRRTRQRDQRRVAA